MKIDSRFIKLLFLAIILTSCGVSFAPAASTPLQLVNALDSNQTPSDSAGGDSDTPGITPDGRYVIFASTADNLVLTTNNATPAPLFPRINVFVRNRTTKSTTLASVNRSGTGGGNDHSFPVGISTNGRYALFESQASDLVANDTNEVRDIFTRDLFAGTTTLISVSTNGVVGNGISEKAQMTPDGRYVAFVSAASNLVSNDTNGIPDVFVRDVQSSTTTLASVGAMFATVSSKSEAPEITPDGRYVAFHSTATNLVPGVTNIGEIYVRDLVGGFTDRASSGASSALLAAQGVSQAISYNHLISADGNYVAYEASQNTSSKPTPGLILRYCRNTGFTDVVSTNADPGSVYYQESQIVDITPDGQFIAFTGNADFSQRKTCINLWNANLNTITLVSGDINNEFTTNSICESPTLDPSGRFVIFVSDATNLVANTTIPDLHLYVRDMQSGTTRLVDQDSEGAGSAGVFTPSSLSSDGATIAFGCADSRLVSNDRNQCRDVFLRDMSTNSVELVSIRHPELPCSSPNGYSASSEMSISADGRYVALSSFANNLVANDTNQDCDIFVCDLVGGTNLLVSVAADGVSSANNSSYAPVISSDGRYVAFSSWATNLVPGEVNKLPDVFVRDLQANTTTLVRVGIPGFSTYESAAPIAISPGGRYVLFRINRTSQYISFLVRDMVTGNTYNFGGIYDSASMTPDGRFVALGSTQTPRFNLWDTQSHTTVYTDTTGTATSYAVSPDGNRIALSSGSTIWVVDRAASTQQTILSSLLNAAPLKLSPDGRFLVYKASQGASQLFLYDFRTQTQRMISQSPSGQPGNSKSDCPSFGFGSRFIAYRSSATNTVSNATNGVWNVFLYDQQNSTTTLLSSSQADEASSGPCYNPTFSGDGRTLVFQSWGSDLTAQDANQNSDLFAFTLLCAGIDREPGSEQANRLNWLMVPGKPARVQFKSSLNETDWQDLPAGVTVQGNRRSVLDSGASNDRFYRIVAE